METVSMTSCSMAPTNAGMTPVLAMSIKTVQIAIPMRTACLAIRRVSWEMVTALATFARSSFKMTTSAVSLAAVEPCAPIAIPTSAVASEGASFTPSPTMKTGCSLWGMDWRAAILSWGRRSAFTVEIPTALATCWAMARWSPVSMIRLVTPAAFSFVMVWAASGRTWSVKAMAP